MPVITLLTEEAVANMLGVSRHAVRKWRREGKIAFIRINNTVRFNPLDVQAFVLRNRKPPVCTRCRGAA